MTLDLLHVFKDEESKVKAVQ